MLALRITRSLIASKSLQFSTVSPASFDNHTLNCSKALKKGREGRLFSDLKTDPVSTLEGIGPKRTEALAILGLKTIEDLANYKFFDMARSITALADTEVIGDRVQDSAMNIDRAIDKDYEVKPFHIIVESPVSALQGLSNQKDEIWKELGVVTVRDLANLKYFRWAQSIVILSEYERK